MIRILFLNHDLTCGGAERALYGLLSKIDRSRFQPELWVRRAEGELREDYAKLKIPIRTVPSAMSEGARRRLLGKAAAAGARMRFGRFDLVQSFCTNAWWTEPWAVALSGARGYAMRKSDLYHHGPERSWRLRERRADRIVAVTREVSRRLYEGTPLQSKVRVILNGVDESRFVPRASNPLLRSELGVPAEAGLFACVASLSPYKGQIQLLVALAVAKGKGTPLHVAFVGRDIAAGEIQKWAAELGVADRAHFLGHREEIPAILAGCDGLVLTSPREGCSNAVLEAMSCGVPVVVSANGAEELVEDGKDGFVVPVGEYGTLLDRLSRLAADAALRKRLGEAARQKVLEKFTLSRMARDYESLWEEMVES
ncbi:MAG: glycosyltransferase family 4 protein [Thermoanaerobaculia bacterium]